MQHLQPFRIRDFAKVISGFAFKSEDFNDEEGVPVVKITNIKNEELEFGLNGQQYVSESFLSKLDSKYLVQKGDILISLTGSHLSQPNSVVGRVAYNRHSFVSLLNQRAGKFILTNKKIIDNDFLYYYLSSSSIRREIALKAKGAANQANISPGDVESVSLMLPSLQVQHKIASILSKYDELIENNKQRIKLLEEMAEEIYKEWFVRFRFPGYESTRFLDGKGKEVPHGTPGALPEGWGITSLKDRFDISLGGTPSREDANYWNGNIPWINSGKANDLRVIEPSEFITELGLRSSATKLLPRKTTVLAITGATLGKVSLLEIETCANQSIVGIKDPSHVLDEYVFLTMRKRITELVNYANGGAQQHINKAVVENATIMLADTRIETSFTSIIRPQFDLIAKLLFKNQVLQQTRDLLLPRLISGKLWVEKLVEHELEPLSLAVEPEPFYSK